MVGGLGLSETINAHMLAMMSALMVRADGANGEGSCVVQFRISDEVG